MMFLFVVTSFFFFANLVKIHVHKFPDKISTEKRRPTELHHRCQAKPTFVLPALSARPGWFPWRWGTAPWNHRVKPGVSQKGNWLKRKHWFTGEKMLSVRMFQGKVCGLGVWWQIIHRSTCSIELVVSTKLSRNMGLQTGFLKGHFVFSSIEVFGGAMFDDNLEARGHPKRSKVDRLQCWSYFMNIKRLLFLYCSRFTMLNM